MSVWSPGGTAVGGCRRVAIDHADLMAPSQVLIGPRATAAFIPGGGLTQDEVELLVNTAVAEQKAAGDAAAAVQLAALELQHSDALVGAATVYVGRLSSLKDLYRRAMVGLGFRVVINR